MRSKTKRKITDHPLPGRMKMPPILFFRMFVIGSVAVIASIWAIWRYYTHPKMPMVVPTPSATAPPTATATATEIEVEPPP